MRNFEKTIGEDGQEYVYLNGELIPCRTRTARETLIDPEAFEAALEKTREEYLRKEAESIIATRDVILR